MYYSNLLNPELQYFHEVRVPNFTIKLTDVLHKTDGSYDNGLFKIEEIIADSIYRIYPLFYTGSITSSNANDKILDNKVIIAQKQDTETYLTFISDENADIQDYQNYAEYYDIGDGLTDEQFNSIVSLLRANTTFTDEFRINTAVAGEYGAYSFDIEDCSFLDLGMLISDNTITAEPKVKLTDNVFRWAKYTLNLTVMRYTDVNIFDDETDNIETETISLILEPNEWIDIPVENLQENDIILFDAECVISFDVPEIHLINGIEVFADSDIIQEGETTEIYAQLLDTDGREYNINDASGKTVYFYEKLEPTITINASEDIIQEGDTTEIYAKVTDEDGSLAKDVTVYFYVAEEEE